MVVIPARMASTRFPGKPLADLCGKPMVQWVVEASRAAGVAERVIVATPDQEILDVCGQLQIEAILTSIHHLSGTDRLAEVAGTNAADIYLNVQGDEPLIDPDTIRACAEALTFDDTAEVSSAYSDCPAEDVDNPSVVKVVTSLDGHALYFSRHAIPFARNSRVEAIKKHIGIYGFRRKVLEEFKTWTATPLELAESLEQLRFLENGKKIKMVRGISSELAVDTPQQADEVRRVLQSRNRQ